MIEKLDTKMEYVEISVFGNKKAECLDFEAGRKLHLKINELVDAVNKQEQVIKMLIDGLERFAKSQQEVNMEITAMITKGGDNE